MRLPDLWITRLDKRIAGDTFISASTYKLAHSHQKAGAPGLTPIKNPGAPAPPPAGERAASHGTASPSPERRGPAVNSQDMPASQQRFGVTDGARYLGVSPDTLRRRIADGTIPASRLGKKILIKRDDLDAALRPIPSANTGVVA